MSEGLFPGNPTTVRRLCVCLPMGCPEARSAVPSPTNSARQRCPASGDDSQPKGRATIALAAE